MTIKEEGENLLSKVSKDRFLIFVKCEKKIITKIQRNTAIIQDF